MRTLNKQIDTEQAKHIRELTGLGLIDIKKGLEDLIIFDEVNDEVAIAYINYNYSGICKGIKTDYDFDYSSYIETLKKYDRLEIAYYFATKKEKALIKIIDKL